MGNGGMCTRKGLNVNVGKSKVIVMNEEEGLECEIPIDWYSFRACLEI